MPWPRPQQGRPSFPYGEVGWGARPPQAKQVGVLSHRVEAEPQVIILQAPLVAGALRSVCAAHRAEVHELQPS